MRQRTNWAGNVVFGARDFYRPSTVSELQLLVARGSRIRVLAAGHSFNDLADSRGAQVSLDGLPPEVSVDSAARVARVAAGLSYAELAGRLDARGFALRNLASLPRISVAGAAATATHGSGAANQNLAAAVAGLSLLTAEGDLLELCRGEDGLTAPWSTWALSAWWSAKIFTAAREDLRARYERLPDFLALMRRLDPAGKFRNSYTDRYLGI